MITASSPGKIILFGEHAVVYDKLGIACSIDKRCVVDVSPGKEDSVFIRSKNMGVEYCLNREKLFKLGELVDDLKKNNKFEEMKIVYRKNELLPSFYVVFKIFQAHDCFRPLSIEINSEVPKNLGSSSSIFSGLAFGLLKFLEKDFSIKQVSDFAYHGDVMAHGGTPSGIDNNAVSYGRYISYRKSEGIRPLEIAFEIPLLVVDSGEKSKTAEMVSCVREQKIKNPGFVDPVLDCLEGVSNQALKALRQQDFVRLGGLMTDYYRELKKLGISTSKLDRIIDIALNNGALGAKPTGAWGGGCCLVLARDKENLVELNNHFKNNDFHAFEANIGVRGVEVL